MNDKKDNAEVAIQNTGLTDLLREAGVTDLSQESTPEEVLAALRNLAERCARRSEPERLLVRDLAIKCLKGIGKTRAGDLVDSVMGKADKRVDTDQGQMAFPPCRPWPEPVDGAWLLSEVASTFRKYAVLPEGASEALALWVTHTHAFDQARVSPLLALVSPIPRCGKTTVLTLVANLVRRPVATSSITAAAMYRVIEMYRPTLLIDEADAYLPRNEDLRCVLNSGHTKNTARVMRCAGDNHEPTWFSTWAPKCVAMIGRPPATVEDRSLVVKMRRRLAHEAVQSIRQDRLDAELEPLRRKMTRWVADNVAAIAQADPSIPEGLHDRAADNWRPLLAIADAAGGDWGSFARNAAVTLLGALDHNDVVPELLLLTDIRQLFLEMGVNRVPSKDLVSRLIQMEERPWPEWRNGQPLSPTQLADTLKPFGVLPKKMRLGLETVRGYELGDFAEAFARYLPAPEQVEQAEQPDLFSVEGEEQEDNVA